MATLSGDDILNRLSASFQQKLGSDNEDYTSHNEDYSDSDSESPSPSTKGSVADCSSEEEAPSFPSSPRISSAKKQKIACDKRERTDTFTRDLSSSTPRRTKRKVVRPKQLSHGKYASKCVQKAKCTIFDFDSKNSVPVDVSKDNTADGKDQANVHVLSVLKDISSTLNTLVSHVENTEKEIRSVKSKMAHTSSPSSSSDSVSSKKVQIDVPNIIRLETRKVYKTLQDEDDGFSGFNVGQGIPFDDSANQCVVSKLIKEVQATNPSFQACQIRAAAKTYFRSLKQDESLERRGKSGNRRKARRQKERISRKLQERQSAFRKVAYQEKDREKWSKVLVYDLMSSEESGQDDSEPLVDKFLESLDEKVKKDKSSQSLRQMKRRVIAATSSERAKPSGHFPKWVFSDKEGLRPN